jgi:hypothetical protein
MIMLLHVIPNAGQAGSTAPSQTRQVHDPGPSAAAAHQAQYLVPQPLQASTRQVVQCLAQLDGIDEAKAYLSYNARAQVCGAACARGCAGSCCISPAVCTIHG